MSAACEKEVSTVVETEKLNDQKKLNRRLKISVDNDRIPHGRARRSQKSLSRARSEAASK
ncbi:predicted protein [Botrytis cinerea T4]|uniref:Uncharacterized protein n=1 Tax=Botryotinia fuckeliana (strain T4) TaxID=999810 RepID=G2YQC9_BOTF4|nr:predicted protein [Botrytis cinerea T4]